MKNILLALFVVPLLTMPAFAGASSAGDKPMIVAENVEVGVGNRHRHRDHAIVVRAHHNHYDDRR